MPALHTKEVIVDEFMKIFLDWNLDRKLSIFWTIVLLMMELLTY